MTPQQQAIEELSNCKELLRSLPKGEAWEQIHAQIDNIDEALAALRSEPSGSVSDEVIRAGDAMAAFIRHAQWYKLNGGKTVVDAWDASRSTPAVPSVEEIVSILCESLKRYGLEHSRGNVVVMYFSSRLNNLLPHG